MPLASSRSTDPAVLVGTPGPDSLFGYANDPVLAEVLAKIERGDALTFTEYNAFVASLAWCQSILATTPAAVLRVGNGAPFPYGVSRDGTALVLGATHYVAGDITLPLAVAPAQGVWHPAGAAALAAGRFVTVTNAERRTAYDAVSACLANLRLDVQPLVRAPADEVAPAGWLGFVAAVVIAGIGAYAGYTAYTAGKMAEANATVESVRVQSAAAKAIVDAQLQARLQAYAMRLAHGQATGTIPPPSPLETQPIQVPALSPEVQRASGWSSLEMAGAVLASGLGVGLGVWASSTTTPDRRSW